MDDAASRCAGRRGSFAGQGTCGEPKEKSCHAWRTVQGQTQYGADEIHSRGCYSEWKEARVTLVPAGGGRYRIQINTALRKAAGADAGNEVSVTLRLDRKSREPVVPADLRAALKENLEARKVFEKLTTGHRRHIVVWFDSARGVDTRIRRLGFVVDFLLKRALGGATSRAGKKRCRKA